MPRMTLFYSTLGLTLLFSACNSVTPGGLPDQFPATVEVQLLAINDFHGALEAPASGLRVTDPAASGGSRTVASGGVARLATLIKQRAVGHPYSLVVAAGDLIGASPLLSSRFHDEPTIEALTTLGLTLAAVGNHEFDEGVAELRRMQQGGCHPQTGCMGSAPFIGAGFQYLAANVIDDSTGLPIFPAHAIREFGGIRIGFIGLTLDETPALLAPAAGKGLHFLDEAATINREVRKLRDEGIKAIVVLIHEGGTADSGTDSCAGPITDIVPQLDTAVDVVISGHTHRAYNCQVDRRLLTSAGQYGTQLSDIILTLDRYTGDIVRSRAQTLVVADTVAEDPALAALVARYKALVAPLLARQVGIVTAPMSTAKTPAGESVMGAVIADAMRAAAERNTGERIDVAFMNPGGVRGEIPAAGLVSFAELFTVQPFGNTLTVLTLSGADIEAVLRQQFGNEPRRILHVSAGFSYRWRETRGEGAAVVAGSILLNGEPLQPQQDYRVVTNDFVASGGDGFTVFTAGKDTIPAGIDVEILEEYLAAHSPFTPPVAERITREIDP